MKQCTSCQEAMDSCITKQYFAIAHLYKNEKPMNMHIHDCYEIYYSITGGKQFLIDNRFYDIHPGDIFFINQYESHYLSQTDHEVLERIVISVSPEFLKSLSSEDTDLNQCFFCDEKINHKLSLNPEDQKRFLYYIHKICSTNGFGEDLIERSVFTELMVFLNQLFFIQQGQNEKEASEYHQQVDEILTYINQNLQNELSIAELSEHFFLSSSYICRIFKLSTGTTINKYIIAKRIALAKSLLVQGYSVNDTWELCGFRDYSNFLKSFTKAVGISPKKYSKFAS
jgi:AraC-like DNA-binding protein/mannose-6-phosphate isomerase-like protein (cupin superfamily)